MTFDPYEFERLKAETMNELDEADRASGVEPDPAAPHIGQSAVPPLTPPQSAQAPQPPPMQALPQRRLCRAPNTSGAGVAMGLAQYLDLDVVIVRLIFILSTVFTGGAGLLVYLAASIIVPKADVWPPAPSVAPLNWREPMRNDRNAVALAIAAALAVVVALSGSGPTQLILAVVLVVGGVWLLNDQPDSSAPFAGTAPQPPPYAAPTYAAPTYGGPGYGTAAPGGPALNAAGHGIPAPPNAVPTHRHRRRFRPFRAMAAVGLLLLGLAAVAGTTIDFSDFSVGEVTLSPSSVTDIERTITLSAGEVNLDLSGLTKSELVEDAPHRISVSVGAGEASIITPKDVPVEITTDIGVGSLDNDVDQPDGDEEPLIILDISVGAGDISVTSD